MKVLRTKEDVLSLKHGEECIVDSNGVRIICEVHIPFNSTCTLALIRKQRRGGLGARSLEELYNHLNNNAVGIRLVKE